MSLDNNVEKREGLYLDNHVLNSSIEENNRRALTNKPTNVLEDKNDSIEKNKILHNYHVENDDEELDTYEPPNKPTTPGAGLWLFCETCKQMLFIKHIKLRVCPGCNHHFRMRSTERIEMLIDEDTWDPINEDMMPVDMVELATDS